METVQGNIFLAAPKPLMNQILAPAPPLSSSALTGVQPWATKRLWTVSIYVSNCLMEKERAKTPWVIMEMDLSTHVNSSISMTNEHILFTNEACLVLTVFQKASKCTLSWNCLLKIVLYRHNDVQYAVFDCKHYSAYILKHTHTIVHKDTEGVKGTV